MGRLLNHRRSIAVLLAACAALFFLPLGLRALWDPFEGQLAEIAREMLELGNWIVPHLNYMPFLEKPPLMIWVTAASLHWLGHTEFAARLGCALAGVLTVWATYRIGKQWRTERVGLLAGAILATSLGFFILTQTLVLEMAATFWMTLIWGAAAGLLVERSLPRARRLTYLLALSIAGGVLTKGLLAVLWPALAWFSVFISQNRRLPQPRLPWKGALLVAAVVIAPWFIAVTLTHPTFPYFFLTQLPILGWITDTRPAISIVWLPVYLLVGFLPWTIFLPKVLQTWTAHRYAAIKRDPEGALVIAALMWGFLLICLSAEREAYSWLPLAPLLALLLADEFENALLPSPVPSPQGRGTQGEGRMPPWVGRGIAALIAVLTLALLFVKLQPDTLGIQSAAWKTFWSESGPLALALGLSVFVLVGVWGMRQTWVCVTGIWLVQALLFMTASSILPELDTYYSTRPLAERFKTRAQLGEEILTYGIPFERKAQSLPFYLGRRVSVLEPLERPEENAAAIMAIPPGTWGISDVEHWQGLRITNLFDPVYSSGEFVLFRKHP